MIYFTADTHFGHDAIVKVCQRPFDNVENMNETLIQNWNEKVKGNDTVYIIGDMFFRCQNADTILAKLKGKKKLIIGNHDGSWLNENTEKYFHSIDKFLEFSDGFRMITLCHYPLMTWKHKEKSYMIHGHIHNDTSCDYWQIIKSTQNLLNAGVDINFFEPVTFDELLKNNNLFKNKDVLNNTHHL